MKKIFFRGVIATVFSFSMLSSLVYPGSVYAAGNDTVTAGLTVSANLEEGSYAEGEVIVTLAAPKRTALAKEGEVSFDKEIGVEESWNFGDAEVLAETEEQAEFLEDKKLYVSEISSDSYSTAELIQNLSNQAYVVSVEPNYYHNKMSVTGDTYSNQQWYLNGNSAFQSGSGINYTSGSTSSENKPVIAIVDTGIDYNHEDLKDHMWKNSYASLPGIYGYDYGNNDSDPMDEDEDGHGTHCAGIIGAVTDNETGIAGVCQNVELMALKILDSNNYMSDSAIVGAFNYIYKAQQLGVNIAAVNCSWGDGITSETIKSLIDKIGAAGALFIFAAGNENTNEDAVRTREKQCPYDIDSDYAVIVGASDLDDTAASFSNYGAKTVDIFAPGTYMFSTVNHVNFVPSSYTGDKKDALVGFYGGGEENSMSLYTPSQLGILSRNMRYGTILHSSEDFYGDTASGSYYVPFQTMSMGQKEATVYMDVSDLGLSTSKTYYIACDFAYAASDSIEGEWIHFSRKIKTSDFVKKQGKTYLRVITISVSSSESGFFVDQVGISTANPDTDAIGSYDFLEGTSMAAPVVTGACAVLSAMFPADNASQRKERLLSCVRKVSALSSKCKTGGVLDMSLFAASQVSSGSAENDTSSADSSSADSSTVDTVSGDVTSEDTLLGDSILDNSSSQTENETDSDEQTTILVKKITLNKKTAKLRYAKKLKLTAAVTPANASNKKIKWSVSKSKYASVTAKGVVKAKKKGIGHTVKVYATAKDGSGKKAVCTVKIRA